MRNPRIPNALLVRDPGCPNFPFSEGSWDPKSPFSEGSWDPKWIFSFDDRSGYGYVKETEFIETLPLSLQLQQLQALEYSGFAFGENVHFVGTEDSAACSHPKVIQFFMALITASESCKNI